ncbi:hypothetical protein Aduo_015777 [Ancylostoma duodenale]
MAFVFSDGPRAPNMNYRRVDPYGEHDNDDIFFGRYRFHKRDIDVLERMLSPLLPNNDFEPWRVSKSTQILMAIRYMSTNSFETEVGDIFGVYQKTVSNVLLAVVRALSHRDVVERFMPLYSDSEQWCADRANLATTLGPSTDSSSKSNSLAPTDGSISTGRPARL